MTASGDYRSWIYLYTYVYWYEWMSLFLSVILYKYIYSWVIHSSFREREKKIFSYCLTVRQKKIVVPSSNAPNQLPLRICFSFPTETKSDIFFSSKHLFMFFASDEEVSNKYDNRIRPKKKRNLFGSKDNDS